MKLSDPLPEVNFKLNGKSITRSNWGEFGADVTEEKLDAIAESIFNRIERTKCSKHKKKAKVLCDGESIDTINFFVSGCCDSFIDVVIDRLKDIAPTRKLR